MSLDKVVNKTSLLKRKILARLEPFRKGQILVGGSYWEGGFSPRFFQVLEAIEDSILIQELGQKSASLYDDWERLPTSRKVGRPRWAKVQILQGKPTLDLTRTGLREWNREPVDVSADSSAMYYWK
jgi:hypothetical protein